MSERLTVEAVELAPEVTHEDVFDQEAFLQELAVLSPIAYDQRREEAAKLLGIRMSTLDAEVATRRPRHEDANGTGTPVLFTDPEPWPEDVNGAELLNNLAEVFTRHASLPEGGADTLALWTIHTFAHEAAAVSPILCLTSPQKRCGKTTVLSLLHAVVARPLSTANITAAALFRVTELWRPTILIDEADTFLRDNEELRGVLNSGHTRNAAYIIRTAGDDHEPRTFCTWAPKAIALIGKLPSTLADRSIVLTMRRKLPNEQIAHLRLDRLTGFETLRQRCIRWAQDHFDQLRSTDPSTPPGLHDRATDNWRPLVAIAERAGGTWPQRVRKAIQVLASQAEDDTAGVLLLEDLRRRFEAEQTDRLRTADIVSALGGMEERPWSEWSKGKPISARQIAKLLAPFSIHPKTIKVASMETAKGYLLEDCHDAFSRYLRNVSVTPSPPSNGAVFRGKDSVTDSTVVTDEKCRKPASNRNGYAVTDEQPDAEEEVTYDWTQEVGDDADIPC